MRETPLEYTDIVFNAKPDAVPYNYRISYKVTQLCLIMRICGRGDVSFALISQENMRKLVDFADGIGSAPIVRFDPSVNRALTYAIGYGLIKRQQNAKYKLTDRGKQLAEQIKVVGDLMVIEIGDLNFLAKKFTERKVQEIVYRWRIKNADNKNNKG